MSNVKGLENHMKKVVKEKAENILFFLKRGIHTLFVGLEPDWEEEN